MIGGRYSALLGCAMLCIGISLLSGLVYLLSADSSSSSKDDGMSMYTISPSVETLVFIMGIILCDCGSLLVNFGFYGFLWHLPKRQALVVSLSNSCFACASFIPLVLSSFMKWSGYNLSVSLVLYAVIILFSGVVCGLTIPSIEEYRSQALKVLGLPIPRRTVRGWKGAKKQLSEAFLVLLDPDHVKFHKITICAAVLAFLPPFIWMSMADPLGDEIFSSSTQESSRKDDQSTLGVLFLKINSIVGLLVGPAVAVLVDKCQHPSEGLTEIMILLSASFAVVAPLCGVADWTVQTIVLIFVAAGQTLCLLYITRYAVAFSYPNRVGTVSGVLVAALSVLTLPLVLIMSIGIVFVGYVWPAAISSAIGCVACALYVVYLKREQPFPKRPTLLAKDELDIAKNFAVATIEDAAYVADMTKDELLALSASTKVENMRRLSNASMSDEAGLRMLKVARRRSSLCSVESTFSALDYPIPPFADDKVVKGTMDSSSECIYQAFNGHGNYPGGKSEPSIEWMMQCIGPPDHPSRIEAVASVFKPMLAASENFGIILEVKDHDPLTGELVTAASCACYPPGELEDSGGPMKVGSERYYWAYSRANVSLSFGDKPQEFIQKMAAFKQDSQWDDKRKDYGIDKMWYVAVLGTHAAYQKRGYGRLLLSIVSSFAEETQHDCYLECSEGNVPFYQSNGYEVQWNQVISVEGSSTSIYGMAKKINGSDRK